VLLHALPAVLFTQTELQHADCWAGEQSKSLLQLPLPQISACWVLIWNKAATKTRKITTYNNNEAKNKA